MSCIDIILIIARILYGLNVIGFILGLCLHKKYKIFEKIFMATSFVALGFGLGQMFIYAILGF